MARLTSLQTKMQFWYITRGRCQISDTYPRMCSNMHRVLSCRTGIKCRTTELCILTHLANR
eukprot:343679-Pleurochrysis_carterae.AAC.1